MLKEGPNAPDIECAQAGCGIFLSVEISRLKWVVGLQTLMADKVALHAMASGDVDALLVLIDRARAKLAVTGVAAPAVVVCYEAGYEGFWLYRRLVALGVRVVVIDPASLLVDRRAKRAKTDRIDARGIRRHLATNPVALSPRSSGITANCSRGSALS